LRIAAYGYIFITNPGIETNNPIAGSRATSFFWATELVQLKLNTGASGGDSTLPEVKKERSLIEVGVLGIRAKILRVGFARRNC